MCDSVGVYNMNCRKEETHDPVFFNDEINLAHELYIWVDEEMWMYFQNKYPHFSLDQMKHHFQSSKTDVLEVYCSDQSQLTHQCQSLGMSAVRFGLKQGDLASFAGRSKLYDMLWILRPKHIWMSPKCGPWCAWSRLNMSKSERLEQQILSDRRAENTHLCLCDALFRLQYWRGDGFHFHLEQPLGSELVYQREMKTIVTHTLKAICDMCTAGSLKHPEHDGFLKKRTQVLTTSRILWRTLEQLQCQGTHPHDHVAGSCKTKFNERMSVSKYSELYTAMFGKRVARSIRCSLQVKEVAASDADLFSSLPDVALTVGPKPENLPEPKRRRLSGKFQPDQLFVPSSPSPTETPAPMPASRPDEHRRNQMNQALHMAEQCTPRVGKVIIQDGPLFQLVQEIFPDKQVMVLDICRGINRMRVCPIGPKGLAPYRRVIGKRRTDTSMFSDDTWEQWENLSHRQQIRGGVPSKILLTVFASNKRHNPELEHAGEGVADQQIQKRTRFQPESDSQSPATIPDVEVPSITPKTEPNQDNPETCKFPESCHSHGPKFRALAPEIQNQVKKIHQNLGHPDTRVLQLALKRYGWPESDIRGCADFVCPACFESKQPKAYRSSHLHEPRDFNDLVSFDGAEWTDPNGKSYSFFHFIDSATNFHTAIPYQQRTTESLIHSLNTAWIRWAGPPKRMMFDSATESNSEEFARYLQEQSIFSYVIPTEAHWQLGRAERHGSILKHMIDLYHAEHHIKNHEDFEQCLIHLCNSKNAMSRHEGFTPELWVLGKMRPLPGNNISAPTDSASYAGLDEPVTEGERFQTMMARREAARLAFVKADHSASLRKALHARSRPDRVKFSIGEAVKG